MYDLKQLRAFTVLAESMHFGNAVVKLGITQSALSQSIRHLEEDVGAPLINRTNRTMALTPLGEAFLLDAKNILVMVESSRQNCAGFLSGEDMEIRMGVCPATVSTGVFESILCHAVEPFPRLRIRAVETPPATLRADLIDGRIDIMVSVSLGITFPFETRTIPMLSGRAMLAAHRDLPITDVNGRLDTAALAKQTFINFESQSPQPADASALLGFEPHSRFSTSSIRLLFSYVNAGCGFALVPEFDSAMAGPNTNLYPFDQAFDMSICAFLPQRSCSPVLS